MLEKHTNTAKTPITIQKYRISPNFGYYLPISETRFLTVS